MKHDNELCCYLITANKGASKFLTQQNINMEPWYIHCICIDLYKVFCWEKKVIFPTHWCLWSDYFLVFCLWIMTAQAPRSLLLFFSSIWHTQLITGAEDTPFPYTLTHERTKRGWPFQPIYSLAPWRQAGSVYACSILSPWLSWNRGPCRVLANALISAAFFFTTDLRRLLLAASVLYL